MRRRLSATSGRLEKPHAKGPAAGALVLFFALVGATAAVSQQEPRVELSVSPEGEVGLQELIQITISVQTSGRSNVGRPSFQPEQLTIVSGPNQSTSVRFVNGVSSQTLAYTWAVQPTALGTAHVRGVAVVVDGRRIDLEDRAIEVVENPPERARRSRRSPRDFFRDPFFSDADRLFDSRRRRRERPPPRLFLEAEARPRNPTVGQQVIYTLYLYFDVNVRNASPAKLPDFKGFWTKVLPQPEQTPQERLVRDGREIYRAVLLERALFPRRAGTLEIEPVEATMTALLPDSSPFGSLMPRMSELQSTSNGVTVNVRPLPDPKPDGFKGLVGKVELDLELDHDDLEVGEAATLTLRLEGEGHLQGIQAPDLGEIPGVQIMPPQQQSEEFLRGDRVRGRRTWSYVMVPKRPGAHTIPSLEMPYFDPAAGDYKLASTLEQTLSVSGSSGLVASGSQEVSLHPVRTANLPAATSASSMGSFWRHLLVLPPVMLGGLLLLFGRRGGGQRQSARKQMRVALEQAMREDKPRQAAAVLEEAWRSYLEQRWQVSPGAPSPTWGKVLAEKGASESAAKELVRLGDDLHYLRYAPKLSSTEEMKVELIERSRRLIKTI